ncbi:hypothetical protein [Aquibacillus saliphilus]|uniref:hypothetical protein n=1 Tax=Aquibacillus saliphilus TaxID=1909422 RepID=UPI001CF06AD1|nr:hypothetical protein [Aquibacillus saliphilus]
MSAEAVIVVFIFYMIFAFFVSYFSAHYMINETGLFESNIVVATMINLLQAVLAIFVWFLYSVGISKSLFFDGLLFSLLLLFVSEVALVVLLYANKEKVNYHLIKLKEIVRILKYR